MHPQMWALGIHLKNMSKPIDGLLLGGFAVQGSVLLENQPHSMLSQRQRLPPLRH